MQILITNGTLTSIQETLSPASGYSLPSSVTVTGASFSYNSSTGLIGLTNCTSSMNLEATGVQLAVPSLNFGGSDVSLFLGSTYVSKVYLGSTLLYERTSVGYNVTFTASGRWSDAGTSYGVKIFDGQDTNGRLLLNSIPGNKTDFPQTLEISSGYCTIQVIGSTIMGFYLTTSEYTFQETGSYTWIFTAPINQSGSVDIAVSSFDD